MSTFNLAGSSNIALTPTHQDSESGNVTFAQMPHMLKRSTALTSTDYWKMQGHTLRFITTGTASRVRAAFVRTGFNTFTFSPDYHNMSKVTPRQTPLTGVSAIALTSTPVMGRTRIKIKNQGVTFGQSNAVTKKAAFVLSAVSAITFTPSGIRSRALSGVSALTFVTLGGGTPQSIIGNTSALVITQVGTVRVSKHLSATHALAIMSGGYSV